MGTLSLDDLEINQSLVINFLLEGKTFEFETIIKNKNKSQTYLEPIRIEDKILGLNNPNIKINLILNRENNKPVVWERCNLVTIRDKDLNSFYKVEGSLKGREINRRKDFRVFIGLQGEVLLGANRSVQTGTIKDLSSSGFSVIFDKLEIKAKVGDLARITFDDKELNYHIVLMGKIVREEELEDGRIIYGCVFIKYYSTIGEYLNLKQREELVKHSNIDSKSRASFDMIKKTRKVIS